MKRKIWLDNLKLIACIAVFWGHFYSSFFGQIQDHSKMMSTDKMLIFLVEHAFNFMFNGGWWVFIFCIISGWLAWKKEIDSIDKLMKAVLHRYLRFATSVLIANIIVVVISKTIGFHATEVGRELNNAWLEVNYENAPQTSHILKSAILLNNEFVGPLWVLLYIFAGTCILYSWKYIATKLNIKNTEACLIILAAWPLLYYTSYKYGSSWFYAATVVGGALLSIGNHTIDKGTSNSNMISMVGLLIIVIVLNLWVFDKNWYFFSAWLFMWFATRSSKWQGLMESNDFINRGGHLSFTIYLLHCPILYSVSMLIYKYLIDKNVSYSATAIINLLISTVIVIAFCELYYQLIQKRLDAMITRI